MEIDALKERLILLDRRLQEALRRPETQDALTNTVEAGPNEEPELPLLTFSGGDETKVAEKEAAGPSEEHLASPAKEHHLSPARQILAKRK